MSQFSLDKSKIRFLLLEGVHQNALDVLNAAGYTNIEYLKTALDEDALIEKIKDAHFVGLRSRTQLTDKVIEAANKLIAVGCFCIGTNQVRLETAMHKGIPVFNAPYSNTRSVAELVLAQAILLLRGIPEKNFIVHRGGWSKSAEGSYEARGKTMGIVGYGSIGSQLSVLAESLGMHVIYFDVVTKLPLGNAHQVGSMDELLAKSDVVTLHVPDVPSSRNMMRAEHFAKMKKGSIFINAARGTCVDIDALADAIKSKHLAGAAVDVFPKEPKANGEEFQSPLRGLENVILSPISAAPRLKHRQISGWKWRRNLCATLMKARHALRLTSPKWQRPRLQANTACCISTRIFLAYFQASIRFSLKITSISLHNR